MHFIAPNAESSDHLIDIDSGQAINIRNKNLDQLEAEIAREYGYNIEDCRVEFYSRLLKEKKQGKHHEQ